MKNEATWLAYSPGEPRRIAREGSTPNYTQVSGAAPGARIKVCDRTRHSDQEAEGLDGWKAQ